MRTQNIQTRQSFGRVLWRTIFSAGGKKLLAKGHMISEEDIHMLEIEETHDVWVTELEEGEISEDEAVMNVAREIGCGSLSIQLAPGGRANISTTERCCILVDHDLLRQINYTASVAIATCPNFSHARGGQRVGTVKSTPFVVPKADLEVVISMLKQDGPVMQARPIRTPSAAVLYTDPISGTQARKVFENIMCQRLERLGISASVVLASLEEEVSVARSLQHLLRLEPTFILIASTTAPAGPGDVVGRAMLRAGCRIESFLAPVEPGTLLLLGYKDDIPIVSAPGCFRSILPNVVDLILPPMLARYRLSKWDVASLGHGGLLVCQAFPVKKAMRAVASCSAGLQNRGT
jgi:molybdenum cofactor cytidylyltransferase